jgi:ribosomal-protein-alanine N-acetyltransferase
VAELRTARLVLRQWQDADREPFAALNADPEVMRYYPAPMDRAQSDAFIDWQRELMDERGWGLWALELVETGAFTGYVGLNVPRFEAHFTPAVEIGWRLAREHWGHGYATEGGREVLAFAFDELGLEEVVSFTTVANERSRRVMERLGMTHDPADDFDHPRLPPGHPLRPHVLYRARVSGTRGP